MHSFRDCAGREWELAVNVAAIKRVRGLAGVDLYGLLADGLGPLDALLADPCKFVDVLYCLCKDQADRQVVTDEAFGVALGGDALARAAEAFMEELIDFFPDPRARDQLRLVVAKARQVRDLLVATATRRIEAIDPEAAAREMAGPTANASPTNSPASSGSIPGR